MLFFCFYGNINGLPGILPIIFFQDLSNELKKKIFWDSSKHRNGELRGGNSLLKKTGPQNEFCGTQTYDEKCPNGSKYENPGSMPLWIDFFLNQNSKLLKKYFGFLARSNIFIWHMRHFREKGVFPAFLSAECVSWI